MTTQLQTADAPRENWVRSGAIVFGIGLVGSAVIGLLAGLIWGVAAPRAQLQKVGNGVADYVNVETRAFIGADAWFCGIAVVAGLLTGILGYRFLVARRGDGDRAAATLGLVLGAVAGAFVMQWLGGQIGLSTFNHDLAYSANGTLFNASLALGAKSALAFWPLFTSVIILIAEWGTRRDTSDTAPLSYGGDPT
ncbi:MAG TPA: hypothetical protein VK817_19105 [Trebonia sp.]|jgi:hypothetical protein|nr:hypothetical protein [Trebonia sp.]